MKKIRNILIFYLIFKIAAGGFMISLSYEYVTNSISSIGARNFIVLLMQDRERSIVTQPAKVIKVIDGNTLLVEVLFKRDGPQKIKISDISVTKNGNIKAIEYLKNKVEGKVVFLEKDVKGKITGYIWFKAPLKAKVESITKNMLNANMVNEGYAKLKADQSKSKYAILISNMIN